MFAYTDEGTEARGPAGGQYGTRRLLSAVTHTGHADPAALVAAVTADAQRFAAHRRPADDRTPVCIRRHTIALPAPRRR